MITFGPVPSRRLGRSLGINNIITPKKCSYNCIYCQVGKTRQLSVKREAFFSPEAIEKSVSTHLKQLKDQDMPDYLTFVSNGEPTLDINLGKSITRLKAIGIPVALITNGSLLSDEQVYEEISAADWISAKIDAADEEIWNKINRPLSSLDFETILQGISDFFKSFNGIACTETMLVKGINDSLDHIYRLSGIIHAANPSKAYISIPIRPPSEKVVSPPDEEQLNIAWQTFDSAGVDTELLTGFEGTNAGSTGNIYEDILNITAVHPLREDSLHELLIKDNANDHVVKSLISQRLIKMVEYNGKKYFLRQYNS
jgi:wyosine [tRNA(Phe)-imidazoG37] synthetase (radical SAM superfamily)